MENIKVYNVLFSLNFRYYYTPGYNRILMYKCNFNDNFASYKRASSYRPDNHSCVTILANKSNITTSDRIAFVQ